MSHRNNLKTIQETFYQAVIDNDPTPIDDAIVPLKNLSTAKCLEIYVNGYAARLTEALGDTFEATWWVMGDENFFKAASNYIKGHQSPFFDLADYGEDFAHHLQMNSLDREIPFIIDLAKFEWLFSKVFHQKDQERDLIDYGRLNQELLLGLKVQPGIRIFNSHFPIHSIWSYRSRSVEVVDELLKNNPPDKDYPLFMLKRKGKVQIKPLSKPLLELVEGFMAGKSFIDVIDEFTDRHCEMTNQKIQNLFSEFAQLGIATLNGS